MAQIIRFPKSPRWSAHAARLWIENLDGLADHLARVKNRETDMSELQFGGGKQHANRDGSGRNRNCVAASPAATHANIFMDPRLAPSAAGFRGGH